MVGKRGQIAIFIVLGLIILFGIVLFFSFQISSLGAAGNSEEVIGTATQLSFSKKSVENFIQGCINAELKNSLQLVSLKGGYYEVPEPSEIFSGFEIPIYSSVQEDNTVQFSMPSLEVVTRELERAITEGLFLCLDNFKDFKSVEISSEMFAVNVTVFIKNDFVEADVILPVQVKSGDIVVVFDRFRGGIPSRFLYVYNVIQEVVEMQKEDITVLPFSQILILAFDKEFRYTYKMYNKKVVNSFLFENALESDKPLYFNFVTEYRGVAT